MNRFLLGIAAAALLMAQANTALAATVKLTGVPTFLVWLAGSLVMIGSITTSRALLLVTMAAELLMTTS